MLVLSRWEISVGFGWLQNQLKCHVTEHGYETVFGNEINFQLFSCWVSSNLIVFTVNVTRLTGLIIGLWRDQFS